MIGSKKLGFDDVMIVPSHNVFPSSMELSNADFPFATGGEYAGTFEIANHLSQSENMVYLRRGYDIEELFDFYFTPRPTVIYTMNTSELELHKWNSLKSKLPKGNITDVFIEGTVGFEYHEFVEKFRNENADMTLHLGRVCTPAAALYIAPLADFVVVGQPENALGVGYPEMTSIFDCVQILGQYDAEVIVWGAKGIPEIMKSLLAGACRVVSTEIFEPHPECFGEVGVEDGTMFIKLGKNKIEVSGTITNTVKQVVEEMTNVYEAVGVCNLSDFQRLTKLIRV